MNVNPLDELITTDNTAQVVCEGVAITPIVYNLTGGATGATLTWDQTPAGINPIAIAGGNATISGTPTANITTPTTYTYTLISTGGSCPDTKTGTITVNPDGEITLSNGTQNQTLCEDTAITPIEFTLAGGATSSSISWDVTPTGLSYNTTTHTLSGSPTGIANQTAYTYTITTAGSGCTAGTISGTITVDPLDELAINDPATQIQTVCAGDPIQNIVFTYGGGATGSTLSWDLDPGLGFIDGGPGSSATISGTPSVNINTTTTYTYTLTSTGGSCPDVKSGSITINPDGEISLSNGSLDQTVCEDTAIIPIELSIAGGANSSGLVWTNGTPGGLIYNSTTAQTQFYNGSAWENTGPDLLLVEYLILAVCSNVFDTEQYFSKDKSTAL